MSTCTRCGDPFGCAMADGADAPCWCTRLPPVVPVPVPVPTPAASADAAQAAGCWCPRCLAQHIAQRRRPAHDTDSAA